MDFRILGSLEAAENGRSLALGGTQQRALLALLLIHRNRALTIDRLVDELWGGRPPPTAVKTLQGYVSNLRKSLPADMIVTRGRGYMLNVAPNQVDVARFEAMVAEGRQALRDGDPAIASKRLSSALALWRGDPLSDFAYEPFAQSEIARLEELRLAALEDRIDADLALGKHAALVGELEPLAHEHPSRERLTGQLMLALYRSGRQAEALESYRKARRALVDELGIEPGPALQELERAILAQDPALEPPAPTSTLGRLLPARAGARSGLMVVAGAALLLAAAIAAAVLTGVGGGGSGLASLAPNSLGLVDPATDHLRASVPIAGTPARVQVSGRQVWVTSDDARTASRVNATTPSVARVVQVGEFPSDFALGEGAVWVIDRVRGRLVKISPDYGAVLGTAAIGSTQTLSTTEDRYDLDPWSIAAGTGGVWITDGSSLLRRADPSSGRIVDTYDVRAPLNGVAVGERAVWAISGSSATVLRIDPRSGRVTARIVIVANRGAESPYPIAIAAGLGSVWVLNATAASVTRIDPVQALVTDTVQVGIERVPLRLAVGAGAAWVADGDGTLARIDVTTNALSTTAIAPSLYDVGVGAGGVWVTSGTTSAGGSLAASTPVGGQAQALPASQCSPIYSAPGARPTYLITSDLPVGGLSLLHDASAQLEQAIVFALRERGFRAGRFTIGYQACDDYDIAQTSSAAVSARCGPNMRAYAADSSVIGVIGPFTSPCASAEIAIADHASGGPLAMISPAATEVGLTHRAPGSQPGEPGIYYPAGVRNFVRIVASDDVQGAADAQLAQQLGLRRVFVTHDGFGPSSYGTAIAQSFGQAAARLRLGIAGLGAWPAPVGTGGVANLPAIARLVRTIASTHPDGIFLGGFEADPAVSPLIKGLRAAMPGAQLIGPDGFAFFPQLVRDVGPAVEGMLVSEPEIAPSLLPGPRQQFVAQFGKQIGGTFYPWTAYGAQAADVLLDAIALSNGTRASVTKALFAIHVRDGIIGTFAFTPTGDTTAGSVTIIRVEHGQPLPLRAITPPANLASSR